MFKKIMSLFLVAIMLCSFGISAFATTDYTAGTDVYYSATADNDGDGQPDAKESWNVTVPAELNPGKTGTVTLTGTWPSNRIITVTASDKINMVSSLNSNDVKELDVTFDKIAQVGSNTQSISVSRIIFTEELTNAIFGTWNGLIVYNVEVEDYDAGYLQGQYTFTYYSSLKDALGGESATQVDAANASVGVYEADGQKHIVLLKDVSEGALTVSEDVVIHLAGHVVSLSEPMTISATAMIDGSVYGSTIQSKQTEDGKVANLIKVTNTGDLTLTGGNYISNSVKAATKMIYVEGSLNASNLHLVGNETDGSVNGIETSATGTMNVDSCTIEVYAVAGQSYGLWNAGHADAEDTTIRAIANYGATGEMYTAQSRGIRNLGSINLYDCYVLGTHSGLTSFGNTYVDGGVYESYGHGGCYLAGPNATHYISNATLMSRPMPDGYADGGAGTNDSAMYIGGASGMDNIVVYVDNCNFVAEKQVIVLRGTSGEKNNKLYISNSTFNLDYANTAVRIDNATHALYLGSGNNITIDDVIITKTDFTAEDVVFSTNEVYTKP